MAKILIAEDIKFVSVDLKNILISLGHEVFSIVENEKTLLDTYGDNIEEIDTVFVSLYLPLSQDNSTASALMKELLELDENINVIIISLAEDIKLGSSLIKSGAKDCIRKPLTIEKIKKVLK